MSHREWQRLTNVERAFFINAFEMDLLAGVFGDLDPAEQDMPRRHTQARPATGTRRSGEYPDDTSWVGAITLVETDAGRSVSRSSPEDLAQEES